MYEIYVDILESGISITKGSQTLVDLDIYHEFISALQIGNIEDYYFKTENGNYVAITTFHSQTRYGFKLVAQVESVRKSKNKYQKIEIKQRKIHKIVRDIGMQNAQLLHAEDEFIPVYIPLRQYLRRKPQSFSEVKVYEIDLDNQYQVVRFKNLFSKYADEISDFEKILYLERQEDHMLVARYKLDENILEFELKEDNIQLRKDARNFAKEIYTRKSLFKDKELLEFLKGRNLFIKEYEVIPKEHKDVWSKINVEDMTYPILKDARKEHRIDNVSVQKKRKYMSKKHRHRQFRRHAYTQIKFGIETYDLQD